jgi:hypothetical protein
MKLIIIGVLFLLCCNGNILTRLTWASIKESIPLDAKRFETAIHAPHDIVKRLALLCAHEFTSCEAIQANRRTVDLELCYADALCRENYWNTKTTWWQRMWYRKSELSENPELTGCTQSRGIDDCDALMKDSKAQHRLVIKK